MIATYDHQFSVIAFVGRRTARRQPLRKLGSIKTGKRRLLARKPAIQAECMMVKCPHHITCFAGQQSRFKGDKGHGSRGVNHRARRRARLRQQARRNIQGDYGSGMAVGMFNQCRNVLARSLAQPGAE
ncbi:hypothetical protein D3C72_1385620 [compost metagenome]